MSLMLGGWTNEVLAQDLQVTSLTASNTLPQFGDEITLTVVVENKSNQTAGASTTGIYYSNNSTISTSDPRLATMSVPQLTANGKHTGTVKIKIPPYYGSGQNWVGAFADYDSRVSETNNNNNTKELALTVRLGSAPDLIPNALTLSKTTVRSGEKITAVFSVTNIGNATAAKTTASFLLSTNTTITLSDTKILDVNIPELKAGASYSGTATLTIPAGSGTRYVGLFVDPHSNVAGSVLELDENNNTRNVQITITTADLTISNMLVSPSEFKANDTITITFTVQNGGQADAPASEVGFYFSTNTTLTTTGTSADRAVGTVNVAQVKGGGTVNVSTTLKITSQMMQGYNNAFYLLANADNKKAIAEGSETNNVNSYYVNSGIADMVVTKFSISPSNALYTRNQEVTISFTIKNNGGTTAGATTTSLYYSVDSNFSTGDTRLATVSTPSLAAGKEYNGTVKVRIPTSASFGQTRYLFAYADANRQIREIDENNNAQGQSFVVASINFVASAVTISPTSGVPGTDVTVNYTIKNTGNTEAPASVVGIYWSYSSTITTSSDRLADDRIAKIAAGKEYKGTVKVKLPTSLQIRTIYIGVYADRNDQIPESVDNYTDNSKSAPFTVNTDVDLQPTKLVLSKTTVNQGERITVDTTVKNNGQTTSATYYIGFYYSTDNKWDSGDTYLTADLESGIAGGQSKTSKGYPTIPQSASGTAYLIAFVDYNTRISETNETNNYIAVQITVNKKPGPNVLPDKVEPSLLKPKAGDTLSVKVTIKNDGTTTTGKAGAVSVYLSANTTLGSADTFLGTATMPTIAQNQQAVVTISGVKIPTNTAAGKYYLIAFVDSQRGITESDENDNTKAAAIDVVTTSGPDLVVQSLKASPTSGKPGTSVTLTFTVQNAGGGSAGAANYSILFANSSTPSINDTSLKTNSFGSLAAGQGAAQTVQVTIPNNAQPGTKYFRVFVDSSATVTEIDENNNNSTVAVTVQGNNNEPSPEPAVEPAPEPVPEPTTEPGPGPEPTPEPTQEPGPEPAAEPAPEPTPEPPTPDAGPTDQSQPQCPGGCPAGEICVNNQCVPVPVPDDDEAGPEDETTKDDETTQEGTTTEAGDADGGVNDTNTTDAPLQDNNTTQDEGQGQDTTQTTDNNTTTDTAPQDNNTTTPEQGGSDDSTTTKDGGDVQDNGATNPPVPPTGCACSATQQSPALPLLLLLVVLIAMLRRRVRS